MTKSQSFSTPAATANTHPTGIATIVIGIEKQEAPASEECHATLPIDVTGPVTSAAVVMHPHGAIAPIITTAFVKCIRVRPVTCKTPRNRSRKRLKRCPAA